MKPTKIQTQLFHKYFNHVLGYGNKCHCRKQGTIQNVTENVIEFYCKVCKKTWGFETKISLKEIINKVMRNN